MKNTFHFISGLPRSGSTLLSAILRQNPRFHASMTSPVASLVGTLHSKMSGGEFGIFFDDSKKKKLLQSTIDAYYADVISTLPDNGVILDTNRAWTGRMPLLASLYPNSRVVCCVRDIGWIIDSIEVMLAKNPLSLSKIFNFQPGHSLYSRVETLMHSERGLIGLPWSTLREAWFGADAGRLIFIQYESLVTEPETTMKKLYAELGEDNYRHDFHNVVYDEPDYDTQIGMPGLHTVRKHVENIQRKPVVPPDVFAKYATSQFWLNQRMNTRNVLVI